MKNGLKTYRKYIKRLPAAFLAVNAVMLLFLDDYSPVFIESRERHKPEAQAMPMPSLLETGIVVHLNTQQQTIPKEYNLRNIDSDVAFMKAIETLRDLLIRFQHVKNILSNHAHEAAGRPMRNSSLSHYNEI